MRLSLFVVGALFVASLVAGPASAAPLAQSKDLAIHNDGNSLVLQVQRRGGRRGGGWGGDAGAAAAGAAIGLAIGAIVAGEAARREQGVEYCMRRYRSYNPETGIWIDRRGQPRQCP